ncbi:MAG: CoA-binding protein [Bacteroidetes bacterium]|nr:CoA-binding protein [Bacteroidota bacterium]
MKTSRKAIEAFLESKKLAIAGVSRDPKKFGHVVFTDLKKKGFELYPVNPGIDFIDGQPCFHSVRALPADVRHLLIVTPKIKTLEIVKEAIEKGINNIWIQQMSDTTEALDYLKDKQVNLINKECILMWADPVSGFHKFHKTIKKIFGALPK